LAQAPAISTAGRLTFASELFPPARSIYLYTHEKMTENQILYSKIGYVEYARRVENGFPRVYMKKNLE
jgi:hypothetical protein